MWHRKWLQNNVGLPNAPGVKATGFSAHGERASDYQFERCEDVVSWLLLNTTESY